MRVSSSPFSNRLSAAEARQVRFVRPELVAEVDVRAWTADGLLRHASFKGLREDKPAHEVVRESAARRPAAGEGAEQRDRAHPSGSALLARRRRHQAGARRLLCGSLAADGAVRGRAGARAGALPRRRHRTEVLPEARLERHELRHRARQRPGGEGAADQHPRSRRADRARADGGARDPSLGIDGLRLGAAGHDRDGSRSGRGRRVGGGDRGGERGSAAAGTRLGSPPSSRPRAARGCTWSRR